MFIAWRASALRPTMDIDMLGIITNDLAAISAIVKQISHQSVQQDGLSFDSESIIAERIQQDAEYEGVRIRLDGELDKAKVKIQIDIGFGDEIIPAAIDIDYPTILPLPSPKLKGYSRESVIAEKFQAIVALGQLNSRMKDFYDIWLLSRQFEFNTKMLAQAIQTTFKNRKTEITETPAAFTEEFIKDSYQQKQWQAFVRRAKLENIPNDFTEIVYAIRKFIQPIIGIIKKDYSE